MGLFEGNHLWGIFPEYSFHLLTHLTWFSHWLRMIDHPVKFGVYPIYIHYHDCGNQQFCCHRATFCLSVPARNQGHRIPVQRHVLELRFVATRSESKTTCYSDVQCIWMYLDVSASFFKDFLMLNIPKVLAKHQSGICLRLCLNWLQGFQLLLPTEVMSCISKWLEKKKSVGATMCKSWCPLL